MIRTTKGLWAIALVGSAAALSGCPNNGGGGGSIAIGDLPHAIGGAYCNVAARCGYLGVLESGLLHQAITDCPAQFGAYFGDVGLPQLQAAVANGTIVYHGDRAQACIDQFNSASCGALSAGPGNCADVFEGTIATGQPCDLSEQCVSTYCDTSGGGTTCPRGTCRALAAAGGSCTTDSQCMSGLYCAMGTGPMGTCTAEIASGGACDQTMNPHCANGLSCVTPMGSTMGTCGTPAAAAEGQPCTGLCDTGLVCAYSGMGSPTCRRPRTDGTCQLAFGALTDCGSGQTCTGTFTTPNGMCVAYPTAGMPCNGVCGGGSTCVGSSGMGTCVVLHHNGEACTMDADCYSTHCTSGTCAGAPLCSM
jgi:hypothetical protein